MALLFVLFCIAIVSGELTKLDQLHSAIHQNSPDSQFIHLNPTTLGSAELGNFVERLSGQESTAIELVSACEKHDATSSRTVKYLECEGKLTIHDKYYVDLRVVFAELGQNEDFGIELELKLSTKFSVEWMQHVMKLSSNSFLQAVKLDTEMGFSVYAGSDRFSYVKNKKTRRVQPELRLKMNGKLSSKSRAFDLPEFLNGATASLESTFPMKKTRSGYEMDYTKSSVEFKFTTKIIPFSDQVRFKSPTFQISIIDFKSPYVDIRCKGTLEWEPARRNIGRITIDTKWNSKTKDVLLSGRMRRWRKAGGFSWLTITAATAKFQMRRGKMTTLHLEGKGEISFIRTEKFTPAIYLKATRDFRSIIAVASFKYKDSTRPRKLLEKITQTDTSELAIPFQDEIALKEGLWEIGFSTGRLRYGRSRFDRGITVNCKDIVLQSSEVKKALSNLQSQFQPALDKTQQFRFGFELFIPFERRELKLEMLKTKFAISTGVAVLPVNEQLTFEDTELKLGLSEIKKQKPKAELQSTIKWEVPKGSLSSPLLIEVGGSYDFYNHHMQLEGELGKEWKHPADLKWLTMKQIRALFKWEKGILKTIEMEGRPNFAFGPTSAVEPSIFLKTTPTFENVILQTAVEVDLKSRTPLQLIQDLTSTSGPVAPEMLENIALEKAEIEIVYANGKDRKIGRTTYTRGLTLKAGMNLGKASKFKKRLDQLQNSFLPSLDNTKLQVQLDIPLNADSSTEFALQDTEFGVSFEIGKMELTPEIQLDRVKFQVRPKSFRQELYYLISTSATLRYAPEPRSSLRFSVSCSWDSRKNSLSFRGSASGNLKTPKAIEWLKIRSSNVLLNMVEGKVEKLSFKGKGTISFARNPAIEQDFELAIGTKRYTDTRTFFLYTKTNLALERHPSNIIQQLAAPNSTARASSDLDASTLKDLDFVDSEMEIIATSEQKKYRNVIYPVGVTIHTKVSIRNQTPLKKQLLAFHRNQESMDMKMGFDLYIPFGTLDGLKFTLRTPNFPLSPTTTFEGGRFRITVGHPIAVAVSGAVSVHVRASRMKFAVQGEINTNAEFKLAGAMNRTVPDAFGIRGFDLDSTWAQIGLVPYPPFISTFGAGVGMHIGEAQVAINGVVDIISPPGLYVSGSLKELHLRDVVDKYNELQYHNQHAVQRAGRPITFLKQSKVPGFISVKNLAVMLAPRDKLVEIHDMQISFEKGMKLEGDIHVFGFRVCYFLLKTVFNDHGLVNFIIKIDLKFDFFFQRWKALNQPAFTDKYYLGPIESMTRASTFDQVAFGQRFEKFFQKVSDNVPQLTNVSIAELNFAKLAQENQTYVDVDVELQYRGHVYLTPTKIPLHDLGKKMSCEMYRTINWRNLLGRADMFSEMKCMTNSDCPGTQKCFHKRYDDRDLTCVDSCGELGEMKVYGCVAFPVY